MYELNIIYFFPLIIAFYFFHIKKIESKMNWLYDLTDYLVFNDDFLIEEYQDNKKENLDDKKKEAIVLKEEPPKYEEKFMHSFYQNNKDSDLT